MITALQTLQQEVLEEKVQKIIEVYVIFQKAETIYKGIDGNPELLQAREKCRIAAEEHKHPEFTPNEIVRISRLSNYEYRRLVKLQYAQKNLRHLLRDFQQSCSWARRIGIDFLQYQNQVNETVGEKFEIYFQAELKGGIQ